MAAQGGLAGHLKVGDGAILMAQSGTDKDIPAGAYVIGTPAVERKEFVRRQFNIHRIDKLSAMIKELQREVAELKSRPAGGQAPPP